jgi:recombination protein RecA
MIRERMVAGVDELDSLLDGGLPIGAISEFVGVTGSGRTTMALAFASAASRDGRVVSWVDVGDALDPVSAALNGVDLTRLLWVRCKRAEGDAQAEQTLPTKPAVPTTANALPVRAGGSPHPRNEVKGMPEAVNAVLQAHGGLHDHQTRRERKSIGTPGAPNRPFAKVLNREEQAPTDRQPSRKQKTMAHEPRCAEPQPHRRKTETRTPSPKVPHASPLNRTLKRNAETPWSALDNALRATDLLLQSGGFGLIVLDLGDVPAEQSWRIPLSTWFRYRAACEHSRASLLVLTRHPCARSSAELVVRMGTSEIEAEGNVCTGIAFSAEIERQRFAEQAKIVSIRKPPQSERPGAWKGRMSWAV